MSPALIPSLLCALAIYLLFAKFLARNSRSKQYPLPPGPFRWPLVGNIFDLPRSKQWVTFTAWRKVYGDVICVTTLGHPIVILNSAKAATDILDRRSSIYSERPHLAMAGELMGWDRSLGLLPYNTRFREMRRLMNKVLGPGAVGMFAGLEERECIRFLGKLLDTPEKFLAHIRHTAGAIILSISYGYDVSENDGQPDPLVKLAESGMDQFSKASSPDAFLVDILPWLKYIPAVLPGAGFKRKAALWRKTLFDMAEVPYRFTKSQVAQGSARMSFLSRLLEGECTSEEEDVFKWAAMSLFGGGADTTVSSMSSFFLAMCTHPHVQLAAQAELERVIGNERLPALSDRAQLPYIDAMVKELLRWAPVGPLGIAHCAKQEDIYEGYRIPAGSVVIANIWGFLHDPEVFLNPDEFEPERFLWTAEKTKGEVVNRSHPAFGFGRRICPGQHLAEPFLFIFIAMTLAAFNITKASDEYGDVVEPELQWMSGTICHPKPFQCSIKPRSEKSVRLIRQLIVE